MSCRAVWIALGCMMLLASRALGAGRWLVGCRAGAMAIKAICQRNDARNPHPQPAMKARQEMRALKRPVRYSNQS